MSPLYFILCGLAAALALPSLWLNGKKQETIKPGAHRRAMCKGGLSECKR